MINKYDIEKIVDYVGIKSTNLKRDRFYCPVCGSKSATIYGGNEYPSFLKCWKGCGNFTAFKLIKDSFNLNNKDTFEMLENVLNKKIETIRKSVIPNYWELPKLDFKNKIIDNSIFINNTNDITEKNGIEFINDNIPLYVMKEFNVRYRFDDTFKQHQVCIPNYDINNNLIGINCRNYARNLNKKYKYIPFKLNDKYLTTNTSKNLFGLNKTKNNIKNSGEVMIFESQKAVMQSWGYGYKNAVAVFGCEIQKYKIAMLKNVGAKTFIIALDKEYKNNKEYQIFMKKICKVADIIKKNIVNAKVYLMADFSIQDKILKQKQAPTDAGAEVFWYLYKNKREVTREVIDFFLNKN